MTIIERLKAFGKQKTELKQWDLKTGHVVKPKFMCDGIQYYELADTFNTFTDRGMQALRVYEEWNMRCTKDYLLAYLEADEKLFSNPNEINVLQIANLRNMLKERLEFIVPTPQLIYNMAAVAFFDENESPYLYDDKYCREKIERWKKSKDVDLFFCLMALKELIPLPVISESDLKVCLNVVAALDQKQLNAIIGRISPEGQSKDTYKNLVSERDTALMSMN